MPNLPQLSRRRFVSLLGIGAVMAALPWAGAARKEAVRLKGHLRHVAGNDYVFSAHRYHCDYCYTGPAGSVFKLSSASPLQAGTNVTLRGRIDGGRFICG